MSCTRSGDRTRTDIAAHGILSPACLPVPPSGRFGKRRANIGNIRRKSKVVSARRGGTRSRSDSIDANVFCIRRKSKVVSARRGGTRSRSDSIDANVFCIRRKSKVVSARRGGTRSRSDSIDANVFCIRRKSKVAVGPQGRDTVAQRFDRGNREKYSSRSEVAYRMQEARSGGWAKRVGRRTRRTVASGRRLRGSCIAALGGVSFGCGAFRKRDRAGSGSCRCGRRCGRGSVRRRRSDEFYRPPCAAFCGRNLTFTGSLVRAFLLRCRGTLKVEP